MLSSKACMQRTADVCRLCCIFSGWVRRLPARAVGLDTCDGVKYNEEDF